jgi:hypothetical protein
VAATVGGSADRRPVNNSAARRWRKPRRQQAVATAVERSLFFFARMRREACRI